MDDILKYQTLNLFLCISVEAFIFMNKWDPIYHLLPLACMILLPTLRRAFSGAAADAYIVDFSCFRPPPSLRVPTASFLEHLTLIDGFGRESVDFMAKVMAASGIGEETSLPPALRYLPPKTQHGDSVAEAETLLFTALDELLRKTRISGKDIDVLVVNCSGFCPAPSLTSLIVNRFSFRDDVKTFNLSGMGCSASIIGIDIARGILKTGGGSFAVVVSTEILSTGWYSGRDRRKLLLNCSFRTGSAAVLLTNRREVRSKYHVADVVRTQLAHDDTAYRSAIREEDEEGETGVTIEREIPRVARDLLRVHAGAIGRRLLPAREKIRYR